MTASESRSPEQLRVLFACGGIVILGGLERMTLEVVRLVSERGGSALCIVNSWENHRIVERLETMGIPFVIGRYLVALRRKPANPKYAVRMAFDILSTSAGMVKQFVRFRPHVIFVPEFLSILRNLPALLIARILGIRVVFKVPMAPDDSPYYMRIWRYVISPTVDLFVANSDFTKRELARVGVPPEKTIRVYNAPPRRLGTAASGVTRDWRRVVFVGQIIPEKGVRELVDAVAILVGRGIDVHLDIVGELTGWAPEHHLAFREELQHRASQKDLVGRVRFMGWREDVDVVLASAGVHCCPSLPPIREAFGVVVVEAKLAGTPSVVFRTGALPELIEHGVDGYVCDTADAASLAAGLEYFLSDQTRNEGAAAAARRSIERFSRKAFDEAWWSLLLHEARLP